MVGRLWKWNTNPIQVGEHVDTYQEQERAVEKKIKIPFEVLIKVQLQFKLLRPIRIKVNT